MMRYQSACYVGRLPEPGATERGNESSSMARYSSRRSDEKETNHYTVLYRARGSNSTIPSISGVFCSQHGGLG